MYYTVIISVLLLFLPQQPYSVCDIFISCHQNSSENLKKCERLVWKETNSLSLFNLPNLFPLDRNLKVAHCSSEYILAAYPNLNPVPTTVALLCLILSVQLACHITSSHFLGGTETALRHSHGRRRQIYFSRIKPVLLKLSSLRLKELVGGEEV